MLEETYPFSSLCGTTANVLIFPNLAAGNIAYKLLMELAGSEAIGPILMGMKKAVHVLQIGSSVREIVNMTAIAVVDAQSRKLNSGMIAYIEGKIVEKDPTYVIIDVNGLGYELKISLITFAQIKAPGDL